MGFIESRDGRAENYCFVKFNENRSNAGDMLLVEYCIFQAVLYANVLTCALEGCCLRCKSLFELTFSHARAPQGKNTWENVRESVGSERPVHSDIGKHKPMRPHQRTHPWGAFI